MALFKILKGLDKDLAVKRPSAVEGFCYFTPDTGKFYIDIDTATTATIGTNRIPINADVADKLRNAPTAVFVSPSDDPSLLYLQISAGGKSSPQVQVPDATANRAGALSTKAQTISGVKTFNASPIFSAGATFNGAIVANSTASIKGNTTINGTTTLNGTTALNNNTTLASAKSLYFGGTAYYIKGDGTANLAGTTVNGTAKITGAVTAQSTLSASGLITASKGISSSDSITVSRSATSDIKVQVTNSANGKSLWLGVGSSGTNRGIYNVNASSWALVIDGNNNVTLNGTATSATKLTTASTGSSTKPVYFNNGIPVVCADTLANNISGTAAQVQVTNRTPSAPEWNYFPYVTSASSGSRNLYTNSGLQYYTKSGTASSVGEGQIILGNSVAQGVAGNVRGALVIYGTNTGGTWIYPSNASASNNTLYLPAQGGTLALLTSNVASATQLQTPRTITISEDARGSATFNGTADAKIALTISNGAVTTDKIKDASVTKEKIADANVTEMKIANDAVTTNKIKDASVTNAKIDSNTIANDRLVNSSVGIAGHSVSLGSSLTADTLRTALGLSNAMHFIGIATVSITDGSTTDPGITGYVVKTDRLYGDVIIDEATSYEYVWTTAGKWERLGPDGSYKTLQSAVTLGNVANGSGHQNTFISQISQNANGVISVGTATLGKLTINGQEYNGANDVKIGTLGVAYGGTGLSSLTAGYALIGNGTSAVSLRAIVNNTSVGTLNWSSNVGSSLITSNTLAYWNGAYSGTSSNLSVLGTVTTGTWKSTPIAAAYGGTGCTSLNASANALLNSLGVGESTPSGTDYYIAQYAGGGSTTNTYHRRPVSALLTYIKNSIGSAGSSTRPIYFSGGSPVQCSSTLDVNITGTASYANRIQVYASNPTTLETDSSLKYFSQTGGALYWYTTNGLIQNQPQQYGYILDLGQNSERHQIWMSQPHGDMYHRGGNGNDWGGSWKRILDSENYDNYAPTKTGGGASGTWGINITGSAGSVAWNDVSGRPSSLKNPNSLTISLNGTSQGAYDGSSAKSINITASSVGAAAASHSHSYLPLSGGTMTGTLTINTGSSSGSLVLTEDDEGGTIRLYSKSNTYCYEMDAYNDETIRIHTATKNPNNASKSLTWNGKTGQLNADTVYGAVWNDYAEFRNQSETIKPGHIAYSDDNGELKRTTERLQKFEGVVSDTFGFAIGETNDCKTPLAVSGRVLVYADKNDEFHSGDCVCAGPGGLAYKMTREEIMMYPERIVGVVSEIPDYETWGTGKVAVDGRIWIKVK